MPKLSNNTEYQNNYFKPELGEYLIANGYRSVAPAQNLIYFESKNRRLEIIEERINFYQFNPADPTEVKIYYSFFGFANFNIFEWIMLLHITNTLPIREFLDNARMGGEQLATEATYLVNNLMIAFSAKDPNLLDSTKFESTLAAQTPHEKATLWIEHIIRGCITPEHFDFAEKLIANFKLLYPDKVGRHEQLERVLKFYLPRAVANA